jgi:hypothetical protein
LSIVEYLVLGFVKEFVKFDCQQLCCCWVLQFVTGFVSGYYFF